MLKGISPHLSPDLLKTLTEMGHGDEIILDTAARRIDLAVFELDSYAPPLVMMQVVPGDTLDLQVEIDYMKAIRRHAPDAPVPERIDRFAFYERAEKVFAVLMTGEARKYGNILLKKGVTSAG